MRLDLFLKVTRLVARRSIAGELCGDGKVSVNGQPGKASRTVRPGDRIVLRLPARELHVEVLGLPVKKSVSKVEARTFYTVLSEKRFDFWGRPVGENPGSPEGGGQSGGAAK